MNYSESPLQQMKLVVSTHAKQQFYDQFNSTAVDIDCIDTAIKQFVRSGEVLNPGAANLSKSTYRVKNCDVTFVVVQENPGRTAVVVTCYKTVEATPLEIENSIYKEGRAARERLKDNRMADRRKRRKKQKRYGGAGCK